VETGCRGGQGSPRAVVPRAVETGCRGGQGSPRAVAPSEEEEEEEEECNNMEQDKTQQGASLTVRVL
jgi:hypothetical protein